MSSARTDHQMLSIGQLSKKAGISISTLRRWDKQGKLKALRTPGNQRRYKLRQINTFLNSAKSAKAFGSGNGRTGSLREAANASVDQNSQLKSQLRPQKSTSPKTTSPEKLTQTNFPSRTSLQPHHFLYAIISMIATVQLLYLSLINVPKVNAAFNTSATSIVRLYHQYSHPQSQTDFNHTLISQALYTGTLHYTHFSQGLNQTIGFFLPKPTSLTNPTLTSNSPILVQAKF